MGPCFSLPIRLCCTSPLLIKLSFSPLLLHPSSQPFFSNIEHYRHVVQSTPTPLICFPRIHSTPPLVPSIVSSGIVTALTRGPRLHPATSSLPISPPPSLSTAWSMSARRPSAPKTASAVSNELYTTPRTPSPNHPRRQSATHTASGGLTRVDEATSVASLGSFGSASWVADHFAGVSRHVPHHHQLPHHQQVHYRSPVQANVCNQSSSGSAAVAAVATATTVASAATAAAAAAGAAAAERTSPAPVAGVVVHVVDESREGFVCEECSDSFESARELNLHMTRAHGGDESRGYICPHCGKAFTRRSEMGRHVGVSSLCLHLFFVRKVYVKIIVMKYLFALLSNFHVLCIYLVPLNPLLPSRINMTTEQISCTVINALSNVRILKNFSGTL